MSLYDPYGVMIYLDRRTSEKRDEVFRLLTGREPRYDHHVRFGTEQDWELTDQETAGGFFSGRVLSESDINFSLKAYFESDVYDTLEMLINVGTVILAAILIMEVTVVVAANVEAICYYCKLYGILEGLQMYRRLGTGYVPDGILSVIQTYERGSGANSRTYLQKALKNQGLDKTPARLKEVWTEGDYKYTVRVHEGNMKYTDADTIYRVSRQSTILDANGQGTGLEYLGLDGNWYHESVLTEFFKGGTPNLNYNEMAAKLTHIPIEGGN